jgi:PIN domain nuclease of toxin-antitoxin system
MKLLLDTHIWIWSIADKSRLRPRVLRALQNPANELWVSPISVWEVLILVEKGRLVVKEDVEAWIGRAREAAPLKEAPLTTEVVLATRETALTHRDPADAFLAATAKVFELTLVTADARLISSKEISVLPNH